MINKLSLAKLTTIYSGYAFREAIAHSDVGNVKVLQTKDINPGEIIQNTSTLTKIVLEIPRSNSFVQKNDVLLASRGASGHKATIFMAAETNIIASASLYILRLKNQTISPEYLAMYLNSADGQYQLSQITTGAYIQNITRNNLENLTIPVPLLDVQKNLVELQKNIKNQEKILIRQREIKNNIINQVIKTIAR